MAANSCTQTVVQCPDTTSSKNDQSSDDHWQQMRKELASITVTTIAGGCTDSAVTDGIGTGARFRHPKGITYCEADDSLLVADSGDSTIRRVFARNETRASDVSRALTSVLLESGALSIWPLI